VRPILPTDIESLLAFHSRLSDESIYMRFFGHRRDLPRLEAERFVNVDYAQRMALVAVVDGELVAIGRYDTLDNGEEAEVAFVVMDDQQGRGIATVLLEHLASVAHRRWRRTGACCECSPTPASPRVPSSIPASST
jgi:GNAT superfamily N-acetyltransferase